MPKVSVSIIVPCFNVAPWLARCLDSLIGQTLHDVEIICIDDKSTDNTLEILQEYAARDKRITVIALPKNSGVAVARNTGLDVATGEYIGFVDPDDYVDLDFYEKLYHAAKKSGADIAKGKLQTVFPDGDIAVSCPNTKIRNQYDFVMNFTSAIYRRNMLNSNNIRFTPNVVLGEDIIFLSTSVFFTRHFEKIDSVSYWYIRRDGSADSVDRQLSLNHVLSCINAYQQMLNLPNKIKKTANAVAYICNQAYQLTQWLFNKNVSDESRKIVIQNLIKIYHDSPNKEFINKATRKSMLKALRHSKAKDIFLIYVQHNIRIQMFGFIPFVRITKYADIKTSVYLFEWLPLIEICKGTNRIKCYIFKILIAKVKK